MEVQWRKEGMMKMWHHVSTDVRMPEDGAKQWVKNVHSSCCCFCRLKWDAFLVAVLWMEAVTGMSLSLGPQVACTSLFGNYLFTLASEVEWSDLSLRRKQETQFHSVDRTCPRVVTWKRAVNFSCVCVVSFRLCIPDGLVKRFPDNCLQCMVQSGAKGSMVCGRGIFSVPLFLFTSDACYSCTQDLLYHIAVQIRALFQMQAKQHNLSLSGNTGKRTILLLHSVWEFPILMLFCFHFLLLFVCPRCVLCNR